MLIKEAKELNKLKRLYKQFTTSELISRINNMDENPDDILLQLKPMEVRAIKEIVMERWPFNEIDSMIYRVMFGGD